jgi:hypothetical protein
LTPLEYTSGIRVYIAEYSIEERPITINAFLGLLSPPIENM